MFLIFCHVLIITYVFNVEGIYQNYVNCQIVVLWVVTPCSDVVGYSSFGVWKQQIPPKRRYPTTSLHGFTIFRLP